MKGGMINKPSQAKKSHDSKHLLEFNKSSYYNSILQLHYLENRLLNSKRCLKKRIISIPASIWSYRAKISRLKQRKKHIFTIPGNQVIMNFNHFNNQLFESS